MKRLLLVSLLLTTPVLAQQPPTPAPPTPPPAAERAWQYMVEQGMLREAVATTAALGLQDQVTSLKKQLEELQKQQAPAPAPKKE